MQFVLLPDSQCLCWSLNSSIAWWRLPVAHVEKDGYSAVICPCHLHDLQPVLDQPVRSMLVYYKQAWLTVPVYMFYVIFCGLRFSHILMTVKCMQLLHVLCVYSVRLAPQCRAFSSIIYVCGPDRKHKRTLTLRVLKIQDQPIHSSDNQTLSSSGTCPSATRPGRRVNRDYTTINCHQSTCTVHVLFLQLATAHIQKNFSQKSFTKVSC